MSLHEIEPVVQRAKAPPIHPVQYHAEFGYLAPTARVRHKAVLVVKGIVFGIVVGGFATLAVLPNRDAHLRSLNLPARAATDDGPASAPVRFVAPTLALITTHGQTTAAGKTAPNPAVATSLASTSRRDVVAAPAAKKAVTKPKMKIARPPRRERVVRTAEPDPRSAYAGPTRSYAQPQRERNDRRPFGFGW